MPRKMGLIFLLSMVVVLIFTINHNHIYAEESAMNYIGNNDMLSENFKIIEQKKIYFAHQSVGYNILDGINDLSLKLKNSLNIVEIKQIIPLNKSGIYHARVGKNGDPISKIDDFARQMDAGIGNTAGIAFFKFCFVDIKPDTDINKVFDHYKQTMVMLQKKYSDTKFIHFTVPLSTTFATWKTKLKVLLKKQDVWEYDGNVKKNEYNDLIRQYYKGQEPVFDMAYFESLLSDTSRSSFNKNNKIYYDLSPEYTYDDGHLNEKGRQWIAEHLLYFLGNKISVN